MLNKFSLCPIPEMFFYIPTQQSGQIVYISCTVSWLCQVSSLHSQYSLCSILTMPGILQLSRYTNKQEFLYKRVYCTVVFRSTRWAVPGVCQNRRNGEVGEGTNIFSGCQECDNTRSSIMYFTTCSILNFVRKMQTCRLPSSQ